MNILRRAALVAAPLCLAFSIPAHAEDSYPVKPGDYVEIGMITVDDGHDLDYMNWLAGQWRKRQDYSKAQGWITGYEILTNEYKRAGEPDLYLVTRYSTWASDAESDRRGDAMRAYMAQTDAQMQASSAQRATYRHQVGSMLLRSMVWKK
ncbi:MAG: hypothetical protein ABIW31_08235 [Novosphingobium sp.]